MDERQDTGIPTRTIHEAWLVTEEAHDEFRRARDLHDDTTREQADLQHAILRFYEVLRPWLKSESALSGYWRGELPDYTGWDFDQPRQAVEHVRERGTCVYQAQLHTEQVTLGQRALADGGQPAEYDRQTLHDLLGLSWDTERLVSMHPVEDDGADYYLQVVRAALLPLRSLDHWQATVTREREQGSGFMAGETAQSVSREFQPPQKLEVAKRLLVEAANRLGALPEFDASAQRTEITREDIERVEEWRQNQLNE